MPKGLSIEPNPFKERENASGQLVTALIFLGCSLVGRKELLFLTNQRVW